jgi:Family of unknown function (DUF6455)
MQVKIALRIAIKLMQAFRQPGVRIGRRRRNVDDLRYTERVDQQAKLMGQMVERLRVDPTFATSVDGGLAWCEARTKCIFCSDVDRCRAWLERPDGLTGPAEFCPNSEFFQSCFSEILRYRAIVPTD